MNKSIARSHFGILDSILRLSNLQPREFLPSEVLKNKKNELIKLLPHWENAEESGIFAKNFFLDNPIELLKKKTRELFSKTGRIISIGEVIPSNQLEGNFIIEGEKNNLSIDFSLTHETSTLIYEFKINSSN